MVTENHRWLSIPRVPNGFNAMNTFPISNESRKAHGVNEAKAISWEANGNHKIQHEIHFLRVSSCQNDLD
jgi:hypothetical protein